MQGKSKKILFSTNGTGITVFVFFALIGVLIPVQLYFSSRTTCLIQQDSIIQLDAVPRNPTSFESDRSPLSSNDTAVVCVIVKDAERYIDEWVDYQIALGFSKIFLYVNEDFFHLKRWGDFKGPQVELIHLPGERKQGEAYSHCAKMLMSTTNHTWAAFFDADEFLVFPNWTYTNVVDFLTDHCKSGAVAINWVMFGPCLTDEYLPIPTLKRCQLRAEPVDIHVKTIAKISDIDKVKLVDHPHFVHLAEGKYSLDTFGQVVIGPFNDRRPANVSTLFHFSKKSRKEFVEKRKRGRADQLWNESITPDLIREAEVGYDPTPFTIKDETAWLFLKSNYPKYTFYDSYF